MYGIFQSVRPIHNYEQPFTCCVCKKSFRHSHNFKLHLNTQWGASVYMRCMQEICQTESGNLKFHLTYSMVQSPSWEANWFAASQEIPCISRSPKVHYRTHKCPQTVPILGYPNPVHIPTSHLEIHPNTIHPSMHSSAQWLFTSGFPTQTLYTHSPPPYMSHTKPISFFSILLPTQYWLGVQII